MSPFSLSSNIVMLTESFPCMILHRRNIACIGCGCPRSSNAQTPTQQLSHSSTSRGLPSPRFNSMPNSVYYSSGPPGQHQQPNQGPQNQQQQNQQQQQSYQQLPLPPTPHSGRPAPLSPPSLLESPPPSSHVANPPKATHPLLTPSGRAFAVGGKVQNVSSDPLSPCIMYWPDNEPFPEQGQIRPSGLVGVAVRFGATYVRNVLLINMVQQPPILNTGNRGPISHVRQRYCYEIFFLLIFLYPATGRLDLSEMQLSQLATTKSLPDLPPMFVCLLIPELNFLLILIPRCGG
jgi:hypothetical protein